MILQFHNFLLEGLCSEYLGMAVSLFVEMIINLSEQVSVGGSRAQKCVAGICSLFRTNTHFRDCSGFEFSEYGEINQIEVSFWENTS